MDNNKILLYSNSLRDALADEAKRSAALYALTSKDEKIKEFEDSILINGKVYPKVVMEQRADLLKEIAAKGFDKVIEECTYIWFNRFTALRFIEVNNYLPVPVKIFSSSAEGRTEPDILSEVLNLDFLEIDRDHVLDLKASGNREELYRYIIFRLCNYLHKIMPFMFEAISDYSELLFPERLLHTESILKILNGVISEEDWHEIEVLGWIYQDYNADKKKALMDAGKQYKPDEIPAVTQLFTPKWIVEYLVENSLGRIWQNNRRTSALNKSLRYFVKDEAPEAEPLKFTSLENVKICDPSCGSGHILVTAFDLLYTMYLEEGYSRDEACEAILSKNLYGLEIDSRAAGLASFALCMKARKMDKNFFNHPVQPNICVLEDVVFDEGELARYADKVGTSLLSKSILAVLHQFADASNLGSLIQPCDDVSAVYQTLSPKNMSFDFALFETHNKVLKALKMAEYLGRKYDVVVTNPPYMGSKGMNNALKDFAKSIYPNSKSDTFAMFIERCLTMCKEKGFVSMITMQSWMFLSSFEKLREWILDNKTIVTMAHLGPRAFDTIGGEVVSTTAFILENFYYPEFRGGYIRLVDGKSEAEKNAALLKVIEEA